MPRAALKKRDTERADVPRQARLGNDGFARAQGRLDVSEHDDLTYGQASASRWSALHASQSVTGSFYLAHRTIGKVVEVAEADTRYRMKRRSGRGKGKGKKERTPGVEYECVACLPCASEIPKRHSLSLSLCLSLPRPPYHVFVFLAVDIQRVDDGFSHGLAQLAQRTPANQLHQDRAMRHRGGLLPSPRLDLPYAIPPTPFCDASR